MIQIKHVDFFYKDFHALRDIHMTIPDEAVTAFIGPSGCGKSTLLRLLNRMNDLISGTRMTGQILVREKNIYDPAYPVESLRTEVGMVFQKPNPFPKSIFENVAYGLRVQGIKNETEVKDRVEQAIRKAALWSEVEHILYNSAIHLSGGQQQRLCIARCLAVEPRIILMDEPASALDPISTAKIEELVLELKSKYTVVIVTHNMQQALRISDRTAFFYLGELIEYNETKALFHEPREEKTMRYVTGQFG